MEPIRVAKRVPKSCIDCYKRRVKCNQQVPCNVCIKRGTPETCRKEKVIVNGKIFNDSGSSLGYLEDLKKQNEQLARENSILKSQLLKYEPKNTDSIEPESSPMERKLSVYGFLGKASMLSRYTQPIESQIDTRVSYTFEDFDILTSYLTFEFSHELINFNFKLIYFMHGVVIPELFLKEHEEFFKSDGRHVNNRIEKNRNEYLWLSTYYALICNSFFLLDTQLMTRYELTDSDCQNLGNIAWYASIECLHRGQYLQHPNIRSLQTFGVLATSFYYFGINFQNAMLISMIYIAKRLNLDQLTKPNDELNLLNFEISCRIWWLLVVIDWFEDYFKNQGSHINLKDFTTPRPRNITDYNLINNINEETDAFTPITYNLLLYDLSQFKKDYYYTKERGQGINNPKYLLLAYMNILSLSEKLNKFIIYDDSEIGVYYVKFCVEIKIYYESLVVVREIINDKFEKDISFDEEVKMGADLALKLVEKFNDDSHPDYFERYWIVISHSIDGAVFLLINILLDETAFNLKRVKVIEDFLLKIEKHKRLSSEQIQSGVRIIKRLLETIKKKLNNQEYKLEINELEIILGRLNQVQSVYNQEPDNLKALMDDAFWEEILLWIGIPS